MATVYFIGGAPRSGKTTVIEELIKQRPVLAASTDAVRGEARGLLSPESNPQLFQVERGEFGSERHLNFLRNDPDAALHSELASAAETWKSVLDFIDYYQRDGLDCAVEGVAILPDLVKAANFDYKAVFFVNLSDQTEVILSSARANPHDWLGKYSDDAIRLYCQFNKIWNRYYADEARKYDFPVIEVDDNDFSASIGRAVNVLLS